MFALFLLITLVNSHNQLDLSKREIQKYQSILQRIEKRQIGSLLISMISFDQTKIQQLIEQSIENFEQEYSTLQDYHINQQTNIYKSMQQLKTQILDYNLMLSSQIDGPQEKEREFYQQQVTKLNQLINQNYQTIDKKEVQLIKLQNKLSQQIDDYDSNISVIDQILLTIDSILYDEQRVGIQFFQKRGKINQFLDILNQSTLKLVDLPMLKQIIQIGIKSNFDDNKTYKQTQELLLQIRNKLVNELNKLNTQKIDQLEEEIQQLEKDTLKMKQQLLDSTQKLGIQSRDTSSIQQSKQRIEEELLRLDEELRLENELFEKKENFLIEEVNELIEISDLLKNRELIDFIKQ